jgi:hypothetical protein
LSGGSAADLERRTGVSKKSIKSDLARVDRMKDADIDYSDIPPLDKTFFTKATTAWPPPKRNWPSAPPPQVTRLSGAT